MQYPVFHVFQYITCPDRPGTATARSTRMGIVSGIDHLAAVCVDPVDRHPLCIGEIAQNCASFPAEIPGADHVEGRKTIRIGSPKPQDRVESRRSHRSSHVSGIADPAIDHPTGQCRTNDRCVRAVRCICRFDGGDERGGRCDRPLCAWRPLPAVFQGKTELPLCRTIVGRGDVQHPGAAPSAA